MKHRLLYTILGFAIITTVTVFGFVKVALAGNPFYPLTVVYYSNNGTMTSGDATTPNSYATAYSYRTTTDGNPSTWIASNFGISSSPGDNKIFPAGEVPGDPAYTLWDVGSTSWTFTPQVGDTDVIVLMTKNGLNGWTGQSWVGGAKTTLTIPMVGNAEADFRAVVMEPIPTPSMQSNTTNSITIHWQGLWDNDTGASGGAGPASVVGYTIYRSVDGGSYAAYANAAQSSGGNISYTDASVSLGHIYNYKLGVRFEWQAHSGGYYEPSAQGPASANMSTGVPQPVMVKYISTAPTFAAGNTSAIQTIQSSDAGGNAANTTSDTTVNLATNSTGGNAKFYSVSGGVCTSTPITSVTIANGTNTAQFCYYDEKAGSWSLTANVTGWTGASQTATVTSASTLGSLTLALASAQKDRVAFTGTNTLTAKDTYGNIMTGFSAASDAITFTASPASVTVGGLNGTGSAQLTLAGDFASGVANLTNKITLTGTSGSYTLTATSGSGKSATGNVTLGGGVVDHFDIALASPQAIATALTGTNTLTARDADNNIITDFDASATNVTVAESGGSGTVSGLGSGNNGVLNRNTDFASGVANLTSKMIYTGPATSHTFKVTAGAANSTSSSVNFTHGPLAKFGVNLTTPQTNAQVFATATITAQDTYGNTVSTFDASADAVTLSSSGTGSLNTTSLNGAGSFTGGVATLSGSLQFTGQAGSHTITATSASGKTGNAVVNITAGTPTSAKIVNGSGAGASQITTTSLNADQTLPLYAAGYDTSNNWTGLLSGTWASSGTLAPSINASSVNTFTFAPTTAPTSGTISFSNGSLNAATGTITVTPGAVHHFVVSAPSTATAGSATNISITAVDQDGNTVTSYTGSQTISFSGPGNGPTGGTPTYPPSVTFSSGVANNVPITFVRAETVKLTATQGSLSGTSGNIIVSSATANTFAVSAPSTATAGTAFNAQITAYDQYGNVNTGYSGDHTITFANPTNAPDGTPPHYPNSVTFASGVGTANISLYKLEVTTLKATEGSLTGTSSAISVSAGAATTIAEVSGNHQTGPVSQALPLPAKVVVKDAYQNPKTGYAVGFAVQNGGGNVSNSSVTTGVDGTAQVTWTLGGTPGTDNNIVHASGSGLGGSPVVFTASATGNGFAITVPSSANTGVAFTAQIKLIDMNGNTVTSYSGTKTISFSGPSKGPNGDSPVYPATVSFINGVANPAPNITLVAVETTALTATDAGASLSGTSDQFTVAVGAAAKLTIVTPPQEITANTVSLPITVCVQDQYGNAVLGASDRQITMAGTSPGAAFSISKDGPWKSYKATIGAGLNCLDLYYKDSYAGARTVTVMSSGLAEATQAIVVNATSESSGTNNTGNTNNTLPGSTNTATNTITRTVTVYTNSPTNETSLPNTSPTTTIQVPLVELPIITSPNQNAFIAAIDGNVVIEGTAPAQQTVRILTDKGATLGTGTSDQRGQWRVLVTQDKFDGAQQSIYAQVEHSGLRGSSVQFALKQQTILERIVRYITQ